MDTCPPAKAQGVGEATSTGKLLDRQREQEIAAFERWQIGRRSPSSRSSRGPRREEQGSSDDQPDQGKLPMVPDPGDTAALQAEISVSMEQYLLTPLSQ